jgi:heme/copper-type cytochrome/quinol oxidase subunit 3
MPDELERRRRARNRAMLIVLLVLGILFLAIKVVKLSESWGASEIAEKIHHGGTKARSYILIALYG